MTLTVKAAAPGAVGVPVRLQLSTSARPRGGCPLATLHEYGGTPPATVHDALYGAPTSPGGSVQWAERRAIGWGTKLAVTERFVARVMVHEPLPVHPPLQPPKSDPGLAWALRVTVVSLR